MYHFNLRIIDNVFSNIRKYADKTAPVEISVYRKGDVISFRIRNKIAREPHVAESNGIGLKSSARLAELVAESFSAEAKGDYFTVSLSLRLSNAKKDN